MVKSKNYNKHQIFAAVCFILPTAILLIGFEYYPAIMAIIDSFSHWDGFNPPQFVGFQNYIDLFKDNVFRISIINVLKWSLGSTIIALTAPLIASELIFSLKSKASQYWYRVAFVLPMVVPAVVIIQVWSFIYEPNIGILNKLLQALGCSGLIHNWLGDSKFVIPSLIGIGFPWISGIYFLIFYAGLQGIPSDVIEYAQIDGCTGFGRIFKIDLPLILGQIKLVLILNIINTLQNMTIPFLMTGGGPGYDSYVPGLYMYFKAFTLSDFGSATSIATVMFLIILLLTVFSMKINKNNEI